MRLKTIQISAILNLDCFCCICLYRNHLNAVWVTLLTLTSQLFSHLYCQKLCEDKKSSYAAVHGELYVDA